MKPIVSLTHPSGDTQRIYRSGEKGLSFLKRSGASNWQVVPLHFTGPTFDEPWGIDVSTPFPRNKVVEDDEIDATVEHSHLVQKKEDSQ
jgi:hypothetical protein